jgi:hypothetical protein
MLCSSAHLVGVPGRTRKFVFWKLVVQLRSRSLERVGCGFSDRGGSYAITNYLVFNARF